MNRFVCMTLVYPLPPLGVVSVGMPYASARPILRCVPDPCVVRLMKACALRK